MGGVRTGAKGMGRSTSDRRRYDSPLRAKRAVETRAGLVEAATTLFVSQGWAKTGMREVAQLAGVAVETLYSHFASKRALLDAVVDHAVVGDDAPIPVVGREEFVAIGRGRRTDRVAAAAALLADIHERTAPFARLLREAATSDAEIAEVLRATRERQRRDVEAGLTLILGRAPTARERDGVWALLSPEVYLLLVDGSGWSIDEYRTWVADTLSSVLPRSSREKESGDGC